MAPAAASQGSQQGCSLTLPPSAQAPSSAAGRAQGCSSSRDFPSGWPLLPVPLLQGLGDKRGCTEQLPLTSPGLGRKGRNPSFLGEEDFSWQHHQPPGASVTHGAAPNLCSALELPWVGGELQLLFPPSLTLQLCPDPFHSGHCSLSFLLFLLNPGRGRKIFPITAWEMLREQHPSALPSCCAGGGSCRLIQNLGIHPECKPRGARLLLPRSQPLLDPPLPQQLLAPQRFSLHLPGMNLMLWSP